jgi:predicted SAM-dependent methyltransferase
MDIIEPVDGVADAAGGREEQAVVRLHWGCGREGRAGWLNADRVPHPGVDLCCDIRAGLPIADATVDYSVAIHALQDLPWPDIPHALAELRRVTRRGGWLRLGLPDLDRAIDAYRRGDAAYFHVPDHDSRTVAGKLVTQLVWYGSVHTPMAFDFVRERLEDAGWSDVVRVPFRTTASPHAALVAFDNRPRESFFVEAKA